MILTISGDTIELRGNINYTSDTEMVRFLTNEAQNSRVSFLPNTTYYIIHTGWQVFGNDSYSSTVQYYSLSPVKLDGYVYGHFSTDARGNIKSHDGMGVAI